MITISIWATIIISVIILIVGVASGFIIGYTNGFGRAFVYCKDVVNEELFGRSDTR